MWIKRTKSISGGMPVTYLQLIKTIYENDKSRQIVIANLGREERIGYERACRLAASIKDDKYLYLSKDLLELLPMKKYGETFLLYKIFDMTSMRRFLENLAAYKVLPQISSTAIFAICAYYTFGSGNDFFQFLSKYFIFNSDKITRDVLFDAFKLINGTPYVHPGIVSNYLYLKESNDLRITYIVPTHVSKALLPSEKGIITIMTDQRGIPLHYECNDLSLNKQIFSENKNDVYVFNDLDIRYIHKSDKLQYHFIAKTDISGLKKLFSNKDIDKLISQEVVFIPYKDIGVKVFQIDDFQVVFIRPSEGLAPVFSKEHREIRDVLITNTTLPFQNIMNYYEGVYDIEETFYDIILPNDLLFLLSYFSKKEMIEMLVHILFMRLFLEHQLTYKLCPQEGLHFTASDAYEICKDMLILELEYCGRFQYIHSLLSDEQIKVMDCLAFI
jgi:hypothetical protein